MRILVTGSRTWTDAPAVHVALAEATAGHLRNSEMVALGADVVLAFVDTCETPGCPRRGKHFSHGTQDCVKKAAAAGIRVETYLQGALL